MRYLFIGFFLLAIVSISFFWFNSKQANSVSPPIEPTEQQLHEERIFLNAISNKLVENGYKTASQISGGGNGHHMEIIVPMADSKINQENQKRIEKIISKIPKPNHIPNYSVTLQKINPQ